MSIFKNSQKKMFQMKILILLSFAKFHCASDDIFLKFLWSKLNFLQAKKISILTKSHSTLIFCNFLNRVHTQLPNLQQLQYVTNTLWKSQTNRTNGLFVVWVGVNRGQIYISLQSNAALNLLIHIVHVFIVWRYISNIFALFYPEHNCRNPQFSQELQIPGLNHQA